MTIYGITLDSYGARFYKGYFFSTNVQLLTELINAPEELNVGREINP